GVAEGDRDADRHLLAQLEGGDRLARPADVRSLAGNRAELLGRGLEDVRVLLGVADAHVQGDLHEPRRLHGRRVREPLDEGRADLTLVALLQAGDDACLCGGHSSNSSPERFATRLRWPSSRTIRTRVGSPDFGSSSITLEMWIGPSFSITPPTCSARWVSRSDRGRVWRFWMFSPSTNTRDFFGSTCSTLPVLPLSLPEMTFTRSSRRIFGAPIVRGPLVQERRS